MNQKNLKKQKKTLYAIAPEKITSTLKFFQHLIISILALTGNGATSTSSKNKGMSNKLWMLFILSSGTSINYSILSAIAPSAVLAGDLEFSVGSYSSPPNGPITTTQTGTLLENTTGSTFVTYTPTVTVQAAFSNQQFTNGLTFGATVNGAAATPTATPVFNKMNTFGSPTNAMFTSTANSAAGTGISVVDNYAFEMFASVQPLFANSSSPTGRYYYGDLTLTFNRPVSDPVIQMVGFGGTYTNSTSQNHGHSVEFELTNTGITASQLSGSNLSVTSNKILNTATVLNSSCASGAACGSVKFAGTNITTLTFKVYVRGDAQPAAAWSAATVYSGDAFLFGGVSIAKPVTVSGTVFDDANGLTGGISGIGANAGGLFANLLDSTGKVVASTPVASNGTYSFLAIGAGSYTVSLSTTAGVQGSAAPAFSLPSNWIGIGEGTVAAGDGTVDGRTAITVAAVDVTGVNFGIEQLPNTTALNPASQTNPGGTTTVQVPTLAGTDPEDGALGSGKTFKIVTLPTNGTLTYNGTAVTAGQTISSYNPALLQLDPNDGAITVSFTYAAVDAAGQADPTPASVTIPFILPINISGTVFSDANADVTINGSDAGTNAGSANLTIYAIDTAGKVLDKATVAANGTYTLTKVPPNSSVTLRLSNDSTVAVGATAPTVSTIPSGWYYTGENKNGTVDGAIANLGNIALTTTTTNLTNENFGIRQPYTITADTAPTTCNPDYRTALNTGIDAAGGQLAVGVNDLNWTAEWIAGPASGPGTPYAPPRPVGVMPAVVVGNLAPGAWINEPTNPANARWISYPFRLSVNGDGRHNNADLDGNNGEDGSGVPIVGTSDDVRLKFTSQLTLPSNASTIAISLPVGVAVDNQFVSIKVNGIPNFTTPPANPQAADYGTLQSVNITNGWQAGVNTIEVIVDSGPDRVGFFLGVQATSTQVCTKPNVLLVKRITAINGGTTTVGGDSLASYIDSPTNPYDDNNITISTQPTPTDPPLDTDKWPSLNSFMLGGINGGKVKPGDEIEYTIYFLSANKTTANNVLICDRVPDYLTFLPTAFNNFATKNTSGLSGSDRGIIWQNNGVTESLTNAKDGDTGEYLSPDIDPTTKYPGIKCDGTNTNGVVVVNLGNVPNATAPGTPINSYGFIRFWGRIK